MEWIRFWVCSDRLRGGGEKYRLKIARVRASSLGMALQEGRIG